MDGLVQPYITHLSLLQVAIGRWKTSLSQLTDEEIRAICGAYVQETAT